MPTQFGETAPRRARRDPASIAASRGVRRSGSRPSGSSPSASFRSEAIVLTEAAAGPVRWSPELLAILAYNCIVTTPSVIFCGGRFCR